MYFEIYNQITHTGWVCFTTSEISFNEVIENFHPGLYNKLFKIYVNCTPIIIGEETPLLVILYTIRCHAV